MSDTATIAAPSNRRISPVRRAIVLAAVLLLAGAAKASAAPNPAANIPSGPLPRACTTAPRGPACIAASMKILDRARARLGLGPYLVPTDFASLPGEEQLLILANLDRAAYGLPAIDGLSAALGTVAQAGVTNDGDPDPSALLTGFASYGWSSNWAGAFPNVPEAYYAWMYYDGWGGKQTSNLDCTSPTATGCWGHRANVLAFSQHGTLAMGASVSTDAQGQTGYAMTLVWTPLSTTWTSYTYTWARAQSDGAGVVTQQRSAVHHRRIAATQIG